MSYFIADQFIDPQLSVNSSYWVRTWQQQRWFCSVWPISSWQSKSKREGQTAQIAGFFSIQFQISESQTFDQRSDLVVYKSTEFKMSKQSSPWQRKTFRDSSLRQNEEVKASDIHVSFFPQKLKDTDIQEPKSKTVSLHCCCCFFSWRIFLAN